MGICHGKSTFTLSPGVGNHIDKSEVHKSVILDS